MVKEAKEGKVATDLMVGIIFDQLKKNKSKVSFFQGDMDPMDPMDLMDLTDLMDLMDLMVRMGRMGKVKSLIRV